MESLYHHHRKILLASEPPTPPITSTFDMNMVIILAALLCALICALGLNSIVRCALRCTRRLVSLDAPLETTPAAAARGVVVSRKGLKRSVLRRIPVVVYGDAAAGVKVMATECTICLGEFVDGEKVRVLPKCNHGYHVRCIDTWLATHSSCPTCRRSLAEPGAGVVVASAAAAVAGIGVEHGNVGVGIGDVEGN